MDIFKGSISTVAIVLCVYIIFSRILGRRKNTNIYPNNTDEKKTVTKAQKVINNIPYLRKFTFNWEISLNDILDVLALIGVLLTLVEMQTDRTFAYRPNVIFGAPQVLTNSNANQYSFYLGDMDEEGKFISNVDEANKNNPSYKKHLSLDLRNIGVGAAEDITITVEPKSLKKLCKQFNPTVEHHLGYGIEKYKNDTYFSYIIKDTNSEGNSGIPISFAVDSGVVQYLTDDPEKTVQYELPLSVQYLILDAGRDAYRKAVQKSSNGYSTDKQYLILNVKYWDMQRKSYSQKYLLTIDSEIRMFDGTPSLRVGLDTHKISFWDEIKYYCNLLNPETSKKSDNHKIFIYPN